MYPLLKVSLRAGVCYLFVGVYMSSTSHWKQLCPLSYLFCLQAMKSITPLVVCGRAFVCLHNDPNKMFIGGRKCDYPAEPAEHNKGWIISVFLSFPLLSRVAYYDTYLIGFSVLLKQSNCAKIFAPNQFTSLLPPTSSQPQTEDCNLHSNHVSTPPPCCTSSFNSIF